VFKTYYSFSTDAFKITTKNGFIKDILTLNSLLWKNSWI